MVEPFHHRSGPLKQKNKKFKSKHATKGSLKDLAKGRIACQPPTNSFSSNAAQLRLNRRNHAKQTQLLKRNAIISATRIFNGPDGAPRIVTVIPLSEDVNAKTAVSSLAQTLDISAEDCPESGLWKLRADRFKTSFQFRTVPYGDFYTALDACKVADYVVFVLSTIVEVNTWGDTLLRTLQAQGLPDVVSVVAPNPALDLKSRSAIHKSLLSFIQYFVPTQTRVYDLHTPSDCLSATRALSEGKPVDVRWREGRSWILGESAEWSDLDRTLKITGVVRGAPLSVNRLVHIPNFGDYQISKIFSAPNPRQGRSGNNTPMEVESALVAEPDPSSADSLVSTNDPDDLANEQTWPTEEEMKGVDAQGEDVIPEAVEGTTPKRVRRIPKGMSEYQAAWIIDEDENEDEDVEDGATKPAQHEEVDEEMQDVTMDESRTDIDQGEKVHFQDLDIQEEEKELTKWKNRRREEADDRAFPDEVDTPQDVPARTRFQRYRGLRSFRTSPWDPFENLPRDYGRIFQFEDFKRTERNVRRRAEQETGVVEPGARVTVHVKDVPREAVLIPAMVVFSLLQHEHKITVLNFTIQRNTEYDGSVRSKEPLVLCVGPRRLSVNPIYSQLAGGGKSPNNVHKFEKYLRHGSTYVATSYGPVIYGKQPCILLRETSDPQAPRLVGMGSFMNPDTTRIIAKRIILSGHPFKVHKKTATIRYMFFDSDDVRYFKPIQLHTKYGRTGHIRESLGTHGYFKAHFDAPINQMDTVCMSLYKRVFPKWFQPLCLGRTREPRIDEHPDSVMEQ